MRIEITTTLTQEDEDRMASAVLQALSGILDILPIAYLIRVETSDERQLERVSSNVMNWDPSPRTTEAADPVRRIIES